MHNVRDISGRVSQGWGDHSSVSATVRVLLMVLGGDE